MGMVSYEIFFWLYDQCVKAKSIERAAESVMAKQKLHHDKSSLDCVVQLQNKTFFCIAYYYINEMWMAS